MARMYHRLVDNHCSALDAAQRGQPFGPGMIVWKVNNHMFAAYTEYGEGLSVRTEDAHAVRMEGLRRDRSPAYFPIGDGWVLLPWFIPRVELKIRLNESYRLVRRDWPSAMARSRDTA